ncbi:hypothetical protein HYFRA_00008082 [Hymenoscyphus fraxineus]|uniref:Uncharacterized protein n=1 Tax=Hymenoscyphus fraxineus TaxID=746836 RepID=A0A9N9KSQ9_9HELO|nr:hypothetical protein HYFRA_00008082 [Hymenoscyphus fraxineus]
MSTSSTDDDQYTGQESYEVLQQENQRLQEDNERLSARVVSLAQGEYQITDDKITAKFREIRDGIDIWIDELQDDERRNFKTTYSSFLRKQDREGIFNYLGFRAGFLDENWGEELGRLETCIYVILGMVISNRLRRGLLNGKYPFGLNDYQIRFLDMIESSMTSSSNHKVTDLARFYRWKGETISAIATTSDFIKRAKYDRDDLFEDIRKDISEWLGSKLSTKLTSLLREKVVQPAVDFQGMIHRSGKRFDVEYMDVADIPLLENTSDADIIDVSEWRFSRSEIKEVFHCWLPALVMKISMDQKDITFVKPVLLGYKQRSIEPKRSARTSPVRKSPVKDRVVPDEKRRRGSPHSQTHQSSRSSTSKSQRPEPPAPSKTGLFSRLLSGRSGGHSESGPSRKGSTPSTHTMKQDLTPQSNALPEEATYRIETTTTYKIVPEEVIVVNVSPTPQTFTDRPFEDEPLSVPDARMEGNNETHEGNSAFPSRYTYAKPQQWYPDDHASK